MQYGDLSNKRGPAIVINADLLFNIKKKWLGLKVEIELILGTRSLLEHWFNKGDLSIYIVCTGEMAEHHKQVEKLLYTYMVPFTDVLPLWKPSTLNYLVSAEHVVGYFYFNETLVDERTELRKHYQVPNIAEVTYLLDGGERIGRN